jgi:hypothetical protein
MRRPFLSRPYVGAWIVLLWSVYLGLGPLGISLWPPGFDPSSKLAINFNVYYYAAEALRSGADIYSVSPPDQSSFYVYLYPPVTIFAFVPYTLVDPHTGFLIQTAITVLACGVATVAVVRYIERWDLTLGWIDLAAIWVFFVASVNSTGTINFGNINLLLGAGIALGVLWLDSGRETAAGVAFGAVALMKVFPAIVGLYLLRTTSWRAIASATATGLGGLLASAVVFGPATLSRFFFDVLGSRSETALFVGGYPPDEIYYVTVQRPLSHLIWSLWPEASAPVLLLCSALVLAVPVAICYVDLDTRTDHLVALHATLTAMILFMPALRWYLALLYITWIALLYVWHGTALSLPLIAGGLLTTITEWPSDLVASAASYPGVLSPLMETVYAVGTMQLYGLLVMLLTCLWYKRQQGVGPRELHGALRSLPGACAAELGRLQTVLGR